MFTKISFPCIARWLFV